MTRPPPRSDDVEEAAALWYARMTSDLKTPADEAALDAWLAEDAAHAEAYAEFCALDGRFMAIEGHPDLAAFRVEAQLLEERGRRSFLARFGGGLAVASLAAAAAAAFLYLGTQDIDRAAWVTARGETREITLSDGSEITLGSDTRLEMAFSDEQRVLRIERGQAFFEVAHDEERPFIAIAGDRTVTALGTAFDLRSFRDDLTVTLVHGRVAIAREGERPDALLDPGQQFRYAFGAITVRDVDALAETSWRTGILDLDNVALSDAVARFNRSARTSIVIGDTRLNELRVSGVFRANDPASFAAALAPAYPIAVRHESSGDVVLNYAQ
jgi:transmembrane sensor